MPRYYHQYNRTSIMAALRMYRERIRYLSSAEIVEQRREIFRTLNGDAFFPLKRWPDDMRIIFWRKPIGDQQTLICSKLSCCAIIFPFQDCISLFYLTGMFIHCLVVFIISTLAVCIIGMLGLLILKLNEPFVQVYI